MALRELFSTLFLITPTRKDTQLPGGHPRDISLQPLNDIKGPIDKDRDGKDDGQGGGAPLDPDRVEDVPTMGASGGGRIAALDGLIGRVTGQGRVVGNLCLLGLEGHPNNIDKSGNVKRHRGEHDCTHGDEQEPLSHVLRRHTPRNNIKNRGYFFAM